MSKIRPNQPKLTYGQLNRALASLGFVGRKTLDFTAYREASHGAVIVLPAMGDKAIVSQPHLVAVSNTITGKGITTHERLQTLLSGYVRPHISAVGADPVKFNGVKPVKKSGGAQIQSSKKLVYVIKEKSETASLQKTNMATDKPDQIQLHQVKTDSTE